MLGEKKMNKHIKNIIFTSIVIILTISLQLVLDYIGVRDENLFLLFVISILVVQINTKNLIYGMFISMIFVLSFNFFQTEPKYSFVVDDPNYIVSFLIFIVVTLIVGGLVNKLQHQIIAVKKNEKKIKTIYEVSSKLLDSHDNPYMFRFIIEYFNGNFGDLFTIIDIDKNIYGEELEIDKFENEIKFCLDKNILVGKNTFFFKESPYLFFPIKSKLNDYGVLLLFNDKNISDEEIDFIKKNLIHLVSALDRETAIKREAITKLDMDKEKFKNALLRCLSHDLKTPLTSIQSGSDLLLSSFEKIEDNEKKELISDIYHKSCDLNKFVVNLLNLSKLEKNKKLDNLKEEAIDDILCSVYDKVKDDLNNKKLNIMQSETLNFVYTSAQLLIEVLVNLVENSIKHTKKNTTISITYEVTKQNVIFNVIDDGGGIKNKNKEQIFDDFYSLTSKQDRHTSNGLGLSICRAIVEAHGGKISAINNDLGGATITFNIPNKGGKNE